MGGNVEYALREEMLNITWANVSFFSVNWAQMCFNKDEMPIYHLSFRSWIGNPLPYHHGGVSQKKKNIKLGLHYLFSGAAPLIVITVYE